MNKRKRHLQASEIFVAAVELPEAERDAYVIRSCGGNRRLEEEVRSLLRYDSPHQEFDASVLAPPPPPKDRTGQVVGRFRIVAPLGEGGMGSVWRAEDPLLRRIVAIKFLAEAQAVKEVARRRFIREARAMSMISHPGIATVFDAGEVDGELYIAMQVVEGKTIRERIREGPPIAPNEAVRIAFAAARAIAHAHSMGVIHRDLTASNILTRETDDPVVVDFGIARQSIESSRLSLSGSLPGTVGYIAPEVIRGEDATPQADVFSLGIVLYEMLTTHLPFEHPRPHQVLQATINCDAEPPGRFVTGMPPELDGVVTKAVARDVRARYATMAEFAADLEALLQNNDLSTSPSEVTRAPKWTPPSPERSRPRTVWLVIGGLIVVAIVTEIIRRRVWGG